MLLPWRRNVLAGHRAAVHREDVGRGSTWHRWSVDPLGARLDLAGPAEVCRAIEDSATVIGAGATAVPNPWLDVRGGDFGEVEHDADFLRGLFERCGLVATIAGTPVGPNRLIRVVGCDPHPTSVVPVGSTVTVTIEPRRDRDADRPG